MKSPGSTPSGQTAKLALAALFKKASPPKAKLLSGFFKTGPGQYGEGDLFLGVNMPVIRGLLPIFPALPLTEIHLLVSRPEHEARMLGLLMLVKRAHRAEPVVQKELLDFYLAHRAHINNWDLVDLSAPQVVGAALWGKPTAVLLELSKSPRMWDRRIAILATYFFIRQGDFDLTLKLARSYLNDPEDLMHKATGWMLREIGKRSEPTLRQFLETHGPRMPRTALRYAIEHYPPARRKKWLADTKVPKVSPSPTK